MTNLRRFSLVLGMALAAVPTMALAAFATVPPTAVESVQTEVTNAFGDVQGVALGLIAGLFGLLLIGIAIRVGWKYARKGGSAV